MPYPLDHPGTYHPFAPRILRTLPTKASFGQSQGGFEAEHEYI